MKVTLYKVLRTPAGIVKRTLPLIMVGVFFVSCNRDVLFLDDFLGTNEKDDLLTMKYSAETELYRESAVMGSESELQRSVPVIENNSFELHISKTGEVELFIEHFTPSRSYIDMPDVNEPGELKYEHLINHVMHLYDRDRNLIGEYDASEITSAYSEMYHRLMEAKDQDVSYYDFISKMPDQAEVQVQNSRINLAAYENAYDGHPAYIVDRRVYKDESTGEEMVNELIRTKQDAKIMFVSAYNDQMKAVYRAFFDYEAGELKSISETTLNLSNPNNPVKEIFNTHYSTFEFKISY